MATYTNKTAVDQIIAGNGHTADDQGAAELPVRQITEYQTLEGVTVWGVSFIDDPVDQYAASEFVKNPRTIFNHDPEGCDNCALWRDEIGDRQREILSMSDSQRRVLEQQLRQRALFYGLNLVANDEKAVDQATGEKFDTFNLYQKSDGEPYDLENMTLFQVEETLDGLTTLEDTQHSDRN